LESNEVIFLAAEHTGKEKEFGTMKPIDLLKTFLKNGIKKMRNE